MNSPRSVANSASIMARISSTRTLGEFVAEGFEGEALGVGAALLPVPDAGEGDAERDGGLGLGEAPASAPEAELVADDHLLLAGAFHLFHQGWSR